MRDLRSLPLANVQLNRKYLIFPFDYHIGNFLMCTLFCNPWMINKKTFGFVGLLFFLCIAKLQLL